MLKISCSSESQKDSWCRTEDRSHFKGAIFDTISDLASAKPEMLTRLFGARDARLYEFANWIDNSEAIEEYEAKSIGRDIPFEKDADGSSSPSRSSNSRS